LARYQVMYWKDIPAQVKAEDEAGIEKGMLPARFSEAIDAAAMAEGSVDSDAYLNGWQWSAPQEREGTAREVADAVMAELERDYPKDRLVEMILKHKAG
jgi:hypothetical protein